jgi:hypothetical protein
MFATNNSPSPRCDSAANSIYLFYDLYNRNTVSLDDILPLYTSKLLFFLLFI